MIDNTANNIHTILEMANEYPDNPIKQGVLYLASACLLDDNLAIGTLVACNPLVAEYVDWINRATIWQRSRLN